MSTTSTRIVFGLFNLAIKQDSTPSTASDLQTFSDVDDLETGNVERFPYASYEPDFWFLNGDFKFLPTDEDTVHVGMMSLDMSDVNGDFDTPPVLTIDFGAAYSADALTLSFSHITGDYCDEIHVRWNDGGGLIQEDDYTPDAPVFTIDEAVADFTQIVITFNATNRPYRYLRLQAIDYGDVVEFTNADIQEAEVVEEIDPLSGEIRMNTCEFTIYSESETFTLFNLDVFATEHQPVWVYQTIDGVEAFMGQYFLETWNNISERQIEFQCVDYISLIDIIPTTEGEVWITGDAITAIEALELFLGTYGIPYELDTRLHDVSLRGWIPITSLREALHLIAFACGAVVDCSRARTVRVYPLWRLDGSTLSFEQYTHVTLTDAEIGEGTVVELSAPIQTDRSIWDYYENTEQITVHDDTLSVDNYTFLFDKPLHTLGISGATITDSGANYAIVAVAAPGTVVLTGYTYSIRTLHRTGGSSGSLLEVTDAPMWVNSLGAGGQETGWLLYLYYGQRYLQQITLFVPRLEIGQTILVNSWFDTQLRATVEKMTIDLARGMVTEIEVRGDPVS